MLFDVGLRGMMFLFSNQSLLPRNVDWGQNLVLELVIHCGLALMVNHVCHILSSIVKLNELTGEIMWAKREWDAKILCQPVCYCQRCIHGWKVPCHNAAWRLGSQQGSKMPSLETKAGSGPIPGSADSRDSSEGGTEGPMDTCKPLQEFLWAIRRFLPGWAQSEQPAQRERGVVSLLSMYLIAVMIQVNSWIDHHK